MSANDYEKGQYPIEGSDTSGHGAKNATGLQSHGHGEAADLYGDVATAEQYGYVERGLKSRHIQFIALGGTIGTGLFLGIGTAFARAGPVSVLLGYSITGCAVFAMMQCLGEMATWLPLPGAIPQYCARYVDPALGFAVGWNNWYQSAITLCAEISAAALVISFWDQDQKYSPAIWISIIIVIILALNIFAVSIYGEAEFIFASIKLLTIMGLLIAGLVIMLGGAPDHDRRGFRYWKEGAMKEYVGTGSTGRFTGLWSTLVNAAFSYGGVEMVAVAAGEAENPRKNIPKAVRRVFWRILFFYVLGSFIIGVTVSSNNPGLTAGTGDGRSSPWVIAINSASIPVLPHIINAVILTSATSSGNAFLYTGSRYLFGVAQNGQAPKFLLKCSKSGVPIYCVFITASISLLTYMSVSTGANAVFNWFQNLTTIAQLFTWCSICYTYVQFRKALIAQGVDRNTLIFKSVWQPYTAWVAFVYFGLIIIFNGFRVFTETPWGSAELTDFFTAYIGCPIFLILFVFWKLFKRTKMVKPAEADIWSGKAAMDAEVWPEHIPTTFVGKFWAWLC
ncbi:amino-acid permease inda1 [Dothidotthia symphoricarpi CBS 119687]|uniref:Amino-acid permease inda1 n=1 Tax=Dothidotthia symphoricarpi CBS 119687 TaxID=1392245 RepID=A0A6A6A537_9PLEO|nr:amino-acid permease inda1 [Dothidotthia symphoricarpi CBS 119687]KAF2126920.1 amino-acid permease inda1 [Dothidotthia symphoricarpi CBS 119687]